MKKDKHGLIHFKNRLYCPDHKNCGCEFEDASLIGERLKKEALVKLEMLEAGIESYDNCYRQSAQCVSLKQKVALTLAGEPLKDVFDLIKSALTFEIKK